MEANTSLAAAKISLRCHKFYYLMFIKEQKHAFNMHMIPDEELHRFLSDSFRESAEVKMRLLELHAGTILEWARAISECIHRGNKLIVFGNGGSAADAQHIAAELVGRYMSERKALAALALTGNASVLTAERNMGAAWPSCKSLSPVTFWVQELNCC